MSDGTAPGGGSRHLIGTVAALSWRPVFAIGALVAVATVATPAPGVAATSPATGSITWKSCGGGLQCATLPVPVDWSQPGGPQVDLAIARRRARDPRHRVGALVINYGGPGDPGTESLRLSNSRVACWSPWVTGGRRAPRCSTWRWPAGSTTGCWPRTRRPTRRTSCPASTTARTDRSTWCKRASTSKARGSPRSAPGTPPGISRRSAARSASRSSRSSATRTGRCSGRCTPSCTRTGRGRWCSTVRSTCRPPPRVSCGTTPPGSSRPSVRSSATVPPGRAVRSMSMVTRAPRSSGCASNSRVACWSPWVTGGRRAPRCSTWRWPAGSTTGPTGGRSSPRPSPPRPAGREVAWRRSPTR